MNVRFVGSHGKGSHGTLYYGSTFATLKDRNKELGTGLVAAMCNSSASTGMNCKPEVNDGAKLSRRRET